MKERRRQVEREASEGDSGILGRDVLQRRG